MAKKNKLNKIYLFILGTKGILGGIAINCYSCKTSVWRCYHFKNTKRKEEVGIENIQLPTNKLSPCAGAGSYLLCIEWLAST